MMSRIPPQLLSHGLGWGPWPWLLIVACVALGYFAELTQPTYAYDLYFNQRFNHPVYANDGRQLAQLLRDHVFTSSPPALLLIVALLSIGAAAVLFVVTAWGTAGRQAEPAIQAADSPGAVLPPALALVVALIVLHPYFHDNLSFVDNRPLIGLAVLAAAAAMSVAVFTPSRLGPLVAVPLFLLPLLLYQSAMNVAFVLGGAWAIVRLMRGHSVRPTLVRLTLALLAAATAMAAYQVIQSTLFKPIRLEGQFGFVSNIGELFQNARVYGAGLIEWLLHDQVLAPLSLKLAVLGLAVIAAAAVLALMRAGRMSFPAGAAAGGLLIGLPIAAFGIVLLLTPPHFFLAYRVLTSFAFVAGGYAVAAMLHPSRWARSGAAVLALVAVVIMVWNLNVAHFRLALLNEADRATAIQMAGRLMAHPDYAADMPLVVVGQLPASEAFPLWTSFEDGQRPQRWTYTSRSSTFSMPWSNDRLLLAYVPSSAPTTADRAVADDYAAGSPCWPAPGSVTVVEGVMVVVLSRPGLLPGTSDRCPGGDG